MNTPCSVDGILLSCLLSPWEGTCNILNQSLEMKCPTWPVPSPGAASCRHRDSIASSQACAVILIKCLAHFGGTSYLYALPHMHLESVGLCEGPVVSEGQLSLCFVLTTPFYHCILLQHSLLVCPCRYVWGIHHYLGGTLDSTGPLSACIFGVLSLCWPAEFLCNGY